MLSVMVSTPACIHHLHAVGTTADGYFSPTLANISDKVRVG